MSSGSTKAPKAPDPVLMAQLQNQANRVNETGPFASSQFSEDADGRATRTTQLSPQMQAAADRAFGLSAQPLQQAERYQAPQGFDQLTQAIGGKVGKNYGLDAQAAKPQQQPMKQPSFNSNAGSHITPTQNLGG